MDDDIREPTELPEGVGYLVYQRELCPDSGREHIQGYVQFSKQYRLLQAKSRVQSMFSTGSSPRMALANGTPEQNRVYCTKSESRKSGCEPVELGTMSRPGKRNDILAVRNALLSGKSVLDIIKTDDSLVSPTIRYYKTWKSVVAESIAPRDKSIAPIVKVYYGVPRGGKTKSAHDEYPDAYVHEDGKWWDDYSGEKVVIYDDFDGSHCTFSQFKKWVDRYPCRVEYKGGMCKLAATTHIITTNVYPSHWWSKKTTGQDGRDAIWGRITELKHWKAVGDEPIVYVPAQFRALAENEHNEHLDPKRKDL